MICARSHGSSRLYRSCEYQLCKFNGPGSQYPRVWLSKPAEASPPRKTSSAAALKTTVTRPRADATNTKSHKLARTVTVHVFKKAIDIEQPISTDMSASVY